MQAQLSSKPWAGEPSLGTWHEPLTGYPCAIVRHPMGHLCGYVGLPKGHPCYGQHADSFVDIWVHGGVTFANTADALAVKLEPRDAWWVGFDCAHYGDLIPSNEPPADYGVYRDFRQVQIWVNALAEVLVLAKPGAQKPNT